MANEERIDSLFNIQLIQAEQAKTLALLTEVKDKINKIGRVEIQLKGEKSIKGIKDATQSLNDEQKELIRISNEINKTYAKRMALESEQAKILSEEKKLLQQRNQELKNTVREENAVKGSIEQRRAALIRLQAVYDNQSPQERASAAGQRLQKINEGLTSQLKELEGATGRAQRNVGNYTGEIGKVEPASANAVKGVSKFYAGLRQIANIIPGLGISGVLVVGFELISTVASAAGAAFNSLAGKAYSFKKANQEINDELKNTVSEASKAKVQIEILTERTKKAGLSFQDKQEILKDYNREFGKTLGEAKTYNQVEDILIKKAPTYIQILFLKARAQAAFNLAQKEASKQLSEDYSANNEVIKNAADITAAVIGLGNGRQIVNKVQEQQKKESVAKEITYTKIGASIEMEIDKLKAKSGIKLEEDVSAKTKTIREDRSKKILAEAKDYSEELKKIQAETNKIVLEEQAKYFDKVASNEKEGYDTQISAAVQYNNIKLRILELEQAEELATIKNKEDKEIASIKEKEKKELAEKGYSAKQKKYIIQESEKERDGIINVANAERLKAESKYNSGVREQLSLNTDLVKELTDKELAYYIDYYKNLNELIIKSTKDKREAEQSQAQIALQNDLADNVTKFLGREKLDKNYQKNKNKLEEENHVDEFNNNKLILESKIKADEEALSNFKGNLLDRKQLELNLASDENALQKLKYENYKYYEDKKLEEKKKLNGKIVELEKEVIDTISTFVDASFERKKEQIQEEIDAVSERKDKEIAAVEASTLSEQDKATKLTQINIKAQADKETLQRRQRELDIKKAQFDKAFAISNIIANTAQGVTAALATLPPTPPNVPLAILVGAIGALQIAKVLATPIPKFAKGTDYSPEGHAIVGEQGTEAIISPSGEVSLTPPTATLTYLQRGSKVMTADKVEELLKNRSISRIDIPKANTEQGYGREMAQALTIELRRLGGIIENKQEINFHWDNGELRKSIKKANNIQTWINKYKD